MAICCSFPKPCPALCDPMDGSTPGFPFLHYLLEFATVSDAIQPSYPLSTLLLLPSVFPSIRVFGSELACRLSWPKYWSFSFSISPSDEYSGFISFRIDWSDSVLFKGLTRVFSSTTVQKHQVFAAQPSFWSDSHILHDYWKNHSFDYTDLCQQSDVSAF